MKVLNLYTFYLIMIFASLISCDKKNESTTYYKSGNISKTISDTLDIFYYDLPNARKFKEFYKKKSFDSIVMFYNNGKIFKTGKLDKKGNCIGKWNYFTREGYLSNCKEFFYLNNSFSKGSIFNQGW